MSATDVYIGRIKTGHKVWAHHGQLSRRVLATFIEQISDGYRCKLDDGRTMLFPYIRFKK
jgi:hypothetical protein